MFFSWDERKNRKNQEKHGISFETAIRVFEDPYAVMEWDREIDGEEEIRIISARKANSSERSLRNAPH